MHGKTMGAAVLALTILTGGPGCIRVIRADGPGISTGSESGPATLRPPTDWAACLKPLPPVPNDMQQAVGISRLKIELQEALKEAVIDGIKGLRLTRDVTVWSETTLKQWIQATLDGYHRGDPIQGKTAELLETTHVAGGKVRIKHVQVVRLDFTRDDWGIGWIACAVVRVHSSDVEKAQENPAPHAESLSRQVSPHQPGLLTEGVKLVKGDLWGRLDLQDQEGLIVLGDVWGVIASRKPGVVIRVRGHVYGTIEAPEGRVIVEGKTLGRIIQRAAE